MEVQKMKSPELKARWIEALRSGKYKQGSGVLFESSGGTCSHCCLGVLCDIEDKLVDVPDSGGHMRGVPTPYGPGATGDRIEFYLPPNELLELWGMNGRVTGEDSQDDRPLVGMLARMNDGPRLGAQNLPAPFENRRYTFEEIATWIEQNL